MVWPDDRHTLSGEIRGTLRCTGLFDLSKIAAT